MGALGNITCTPLSIVRRRSSYKLNEAHPASRHKRSTQDHVTRKVRLCHVRHPRLRSCGGVQTSCYSTSRRCISPGGLSKPLPRLPSTVWEKGIPDPSLNPGKANTLALAPLEQQLLQCLQWLDRPSLLPRSILMRLGADTFWMSSRDANMLERMEMLTETLSMRQKDEMWMGLEPFLLPQHRYPFKQVLRHGVAVVVERPDCTGSGARNPTLFDPDTATGNCDDYHEWMRSMFPEPLQVRKPCHLVLEGEFLKDGIRELTEQADSSPMATPEEATRLTQSLDRNAQDGQCSDVGDLSRTHEYTVKPGVANCPVSADHVYPTDTHSPVKKPGSVRNALNNLFTNPRTAPKPPRGSTSPHKASREMPAETIKRPGSVRAGRLAAERILGYCVESLLPPAVVLQKRAAPQGGLPVPHRQGVLRVSATNSAPH